MILATCFCALSGYYFFYMIVLAAVLYFVLGELKQKPGSLKKAGKDLLAVFLPGTFRCFDVVNPSHSLRLWLFSKQPWDGESSSFFPFCIQWNIL